MMVGPKSVLLRNFAGVSGEGVRAVQGNRRPENTVRPSRSSTQKPSCPIEGRPGRRKAIHPHRYRERWEVLKGDKKEEAAPGGLSKINSNDEQKRHVSL